MGWYAQTNYQDKQGGNTGAGRHGKPAAFTISQIGCFITSFCNLMRRFSVEVDPPTINRVFTERGIYVDVDDGVFDDVGYETVTAYNGDFVVDRKGRGGWPDTNNAIVKFHYRSISHPTLSNGQPNMIDHFCLVSDAAARTIVDSWDGVVKRPGAYGEPVDWATYRHIEPQPVAPAVQAPTVQAPPTVNFELLSEVRHMHVSLSPSAKKWNFGVGTENWREISSKPVEETPVNTNVDIVAIAHHPIPPNGADYFMTADDLGDFNAQGGKPRNTFGYSHADLADGTVVVVTDPTPAPVPVEQPPVAPAETTTPPVVPDDTPPLPTTPARAAKQDLYEPFKDADGEPINKRYVFLKQTIIHEADGRRPDHTAKKWQPVDIAGTFPWKNKTWGRPAGAVKTDLYFAVPMDKDTVILESELYSAQKTEEEEKAYPTAQSVRQRIITLVAVITRSIPNIKKLLNKKK